MSLFDIANIEKEIKELESKTMGEDFWNYSDESSKILTQLKTKQNKLAKYENIKNELLNLMELNELLEVEKEEELEKELLSSTKRLEKELDKIELETLLNEKYDKNNAIVTIHPGARWNRVSRLGRNVI